MMEERAFKKQRGGVRAGSGRPKEEDGVRIRLKNSVYQRWQQVKMLGRFFSDSSLADYLLDLAEKADSSVSRFVLSIITTIYLHHILKSHTKIPFC